MTTVQEYHVDVDQMDLNIKSEPVEDISEKTAATVCNELSENHPTDGKTISGDCRPLLKSKVEIKEEPADLSLIENPDEITWVPNRADYDGACSMDCASLCVDSETCSADSRTLSVDSETCSAASGTPSVDSGTYFMNLFKVKQESKFSPNGNAGILILPTGDEENSHYVEELNEVFPVSVKQEPDVDPLYTGDLDRYGVVDLGNSQLRNEDSSESCGEELIELPSRSQLDDNGELAASFAFYENRYQCFHCPYRVKDKGALRIHIQSEHLGMKIYRCQLCSKGYCDSRYLKRHMVDVHKILNPYCCDKCDFRCGRLVDLNNHNLIHSGKKIFACSCCKTILTSQQSLVKHLQFVHKGFKPYVCNLCKFRTAYIKSIKNHILSHFKSKPYMCKRCDYKTSVIQDLLKHAESAHKKQETFSCNACSSIFSEEESLVDHLKTAHLKIKTYNCPHCSFRCYQSQQVESHIDIAHKKGRTFKCYICDYSAGEKMILQKHILSEHIDIVREHSNKPWI